MENHGGTNSTELQMWVYVSEASLPSRRAETEVAQIVHLSQLRNADLHVTGGLLYTGRRFAQMIEGSVGAVSDLRRSIEGDPRHRNVTTVYYEGSAKRLFQGWSLVYSGASQYMASLLDNVVLGRSAQQMSIEDSLIFLFREFAAQEANEWKT
jgi:hypothetical protein